MSTPSQGPGLVRYDAMCRAIDAAYEVDEVKSIHDHARPCCKPPRAWLTMSRRKLALMLIRMRAARKANQLYDAGEKAKGAAEPGTIAARRGRIAGPRHFPISAFPSSKMSEWRKLNGISDEQFEEGLSVARQPINCAGGND